MTKGVVELALISWWVLEDRGSETSPASHQKGISESPTPPSLFGGGIFNGVMRIENDMVDRHGRNVVVRYRMIFWWSNDQKYTFYLTQKDGFAFG